MTGRPPRRRGPLIRATKQVVDGVKLDSKKEAKRYRELRMLERAGKISNLEVHPVFPVEIDGRPVKIRSRGFPNGRRVRYTADFRYYEPGRGIVIEDTKGYDTDRARLMRAIVEAVYNVTIEVL